MNGQSLDAVDEHTDDELAAQVWALHQPGREDWHVIADSLDLAGATHARGLYQLHIRNQQTRDADQPTLF